MTTTNIEINSREHNIDGDCITYESLCILANKKPSDKPTVTMKVKGAFGRTILPGSTISIVEGMIFVVVNTTRT